MNCNVYAESQSAHPDLPRSVSPLATAQHKHRARRTWMFIFFLAQLIPMTDGHSCVQTQLLCLAEQTLRNNMLQSSLWDQTEMGTSLQIISLISSHPSPASLLSVSPGSISLTNTMCMNLHARYCFWERYPKKIISKWWIQNFFL